MKRICHISTGHYDGLDLRIFHKECKTLMEAGYDVYLVISYEKDEEIDGIKIKALPKPKNRSERNFKNTKIAFRKALEINAEIYHFHDPELIPVGVKLKKLGKKVIYDAHEDLPRYKTHKLYKLNITNKYFVNMISKYFEFFENKSAKIFDAIVAATPSIRNRFLKINPNTVDINNYPILEEFKNEVDWSKKKNEVVYAGTIAKHRGIIEIVKAMEFLENVKLNLAGFLRKKREIELQKFKGWEKVNKLGFLNREELKRILYCSKAGLVTFLPYPNNIMSQPIKLFEYMASGIPVIASNFPLWKEIVEGNNCGICVNPLNPEEIAKAIEYLITHEEKAREMGLNGRKAVEEKYNWKNEKRKLIQLYEKL